MREKWGGATCWYIISRGVTWLPSCRRAPTAAPRRAAPFNLRFDAHVQPRHEFNIRNNIRTCFDTSGCGDAVSRPAFTMKTEEARREKGPLYSRNYWKLNTSLGFQFEKESWRPRLDDYFRRARDGCAAWWEAGEAFRRGSQKFEKEMLSIQVVERSRKNEMFGLLEHLNLFTRLKSRELRYVYISSIFECREIRWFFERRAFVSFNSSFER